MRKAVERRGEEGKRRREEGEKRGRKSLTLRSFVSFQSHLEQQSKLGWEYQVE
jgi:hypothetical protein